MARSIIWIPLLLLFGGLLSAQESVLQEFPFDAPQGVVLDHADLFPVDLEERIEQEALGLFDQAGIRFWVVSLPPATQRETRRAVTLRVHTWMNRGLGLVLGLSADPNMPPHLGVSQDLLVELTDQDLRRMREDVITAWEEEADGNRKALAATRSITANLDLYRINNSVEEVPEIFGLSSQEITRTDQPSNVRGRYRERMENEKQWQEELGDPDAIPERIEPEVPPRFFETLAWRTRVWIINLALFAVIASVGIWLFLRGIEQEKERRRQMEEGAKQLSGEAPKGRTPSENMASGNLPRPKGRTQPVEDEDIY